MLNGDGQSASSSSQLFDRIRVQVENFERQFANAPVEHGAAWNAGGNEVFRREGLYGAVPIFPDEEAQLSNGLFTHVHHNGSSFSAGDMLLAARVNLLEMRAVGLQKGRLVTHIVQRGGLQWPVEAEALHDQYDVIFNRLPDPT